MDNNGLPEGFQLDEAPQAQQAAATTPNAAPAAQAPSDLPEGFQLDNEPKTEDLSKYQTRGQQAMTMAESIGRGASFGLTDVAAKYMREGASKLGVPDQYLDLVAPGSKDVAARKEANSLEDLTGNIVGAVSGISALGEMLPSAGAIGSAIGLGTALPRGIAPVVAKPLLNYGLIAGAAIKGAIESGAVSGGDEISKSILGQPGGDPEATVNSVLAHVGINALMGGALMGGATGALEKIAEKKAAIQSSQFLADFGNQYKLRLENPDFQTAMHDELNHFYTTTKDAADDVYGVNGLKSQAIRKLVPQMNSEISNQNQNIADTLNNKIKEMIANPNDYPARLTNKLTQDANKWMEVATNPNAQSHEVFEATQELKQKMQSYAKYDKQITPFAEEKGFVDTSKDLAFQLRNHLENPNVWGKAADLQKGINGAFTKFNPALKDFESTFTDKILGDRQLSEGKLATYGKQIDKVSGSAKRTKLQNFVDAAEKYREEIANLHQTLGVENSMQPSSLNVVKNSYGEATPGAKMANYMHDTGIPKLTDPIATKLTGAKIGSYFGPLGSLIGYHIGEPVSNVLQKTVGQPIANKMNQYVGNATLKVLSSGAEDMSGITQVQNYARAAAKGSNKISNAIKSLFKAGVYTGLNQPSDKDREKLKNYIKDGVFNRGMQQEVNDVNPSGPPQAFAEGGLVSSKPLPPAPNPLADANSPIAMHYPEQNTIMTSIKSRTNAYLNSLRPDSMPVSNLPFDNDLKHPEIEKHYNKAIDVALQPLKVMDDIKDGTLSLDSIKHMGAMYPELYDHLKKKMTEAIAEHKLNDGESIPYKTRQSMSLFLGAPLDSTMTPTAIQNAQLTHLPAQGPQPQGSPAKGSKGSTNKLGKTDKSYMTPTQTAESDRANRD